jgi:hypothetical protein
MNREIGRLRRSRTIALRYCCAASGNLQILSPTRFAIQIPLIFWYNPINPAPLRSGVRYEISLWTGNSHDSLGFSTPRTTTHAADACGAEDGGLERR